MTIHPAQAAQMTTLRQDEALTKVPPEYGDYADVFSFDLVMGLPENTGINEHAIELKVDK